MKNTDISQLFGVPFGAQADSSTIAAIPATKTAIGRASMALGFPKENFQPLDNGGQPVSGADLNGILNTLARSAQAAELGVLHPFSASYAEAIGGYPSGATIAHPTIAGRFLICTEDGNTNAPSQNMAGWADPLANMAGHEDLASYATTAALNAEQKRAEAAEAAIFQIPVWMPIPCPFATAPSGFLPADGRTITADEYPQLASYYTSLQLPDIRGLFIRGLDPSGVLDNYPGGRTPLSVEEGSRITGEWSSDFCGISMVTNNNNTQASRTAGMAALGWDIPSNQTESFPAYHWSGNAWIASYSSGEILGITRPKNMAWNYVFRAA